MSVFWLVMAIAYALAAWATFMFAGLANKKVGNAAKPGQDLSMGLLWPITLVMCTVMALVVVVKLRRARHVSSDTNSAHRSKGIDQGKE